MQVAHNENQTGFDSNENNQHIYINYQRASDSRESLHFQLAGTMEHR